MRGTWQSQFPVMPVRTVSINVATKYYEMFWRYFVMVWKIRKTFYMEICFERQQKARSLATQVSPISWNTWNIDQVLATFNHSCIPLRPVQETPRVDPAPFFRESKSIMEDYHPPPTDTETEAQGSGSSRSFKSQESLEKNPDFSIPVQLSAHWAAMPRWVSARYSSFSKPDRI